jgi:class 3 adenylate cyclase
MALAMQRRLAHLNAAWRQRGIERPFRARMGINTGFCNVGNFGSDDRLAYTIIGAEANLAARLQAIAEPGGIVLSYETYALVRERTRARALAPIQVKGISRTIVPYAVEGLAAGSADGDIIAEHRAGLDLFLDVAALAGERGAALATLRRAIAALEAGEPAVEPSVVTSPPA